MVNHYLDIHTHQRMQQAENRQILNVRADDYAEADCLDWISVGLHPWYLNEVSMVEQLGLVERLAGDNRIRLIGECGFDRLRGPGLPIQQRAFERQAELAVQCGKLDPTKIRVA